jgi:4-hydroxybutyrate CoA-transferase
MQTIASAEAVINREILAPGSVIYASGNASTPQVLLRQLAADATIQDVTLYSILLLGEGLEPLFTRERCQTLTHRVIFNSHLTREAVNNGWAKYHPWHLSEVPQALRLPSGPNIVLLTVSGPDNGGNYSLGTTVEAIFAAIRAAKDRGGLVIAERNRRMPFVLGTTIPQSAIDYLIDTDYALPLSPVTAPDDRAKRIGEIIAALYIRDGSGLEPGSTLQYGIGEVPAAVTDAILRKQARDLGIHTELFSDAMIRLVEAGAVTNRWKKTVDFSVSSIFLAGDRRGYEWLHYNSSVQSRPCGYTNSIYRIAEQPRMVAINSAIGVDLHGNIWADSLEARRIYSGVGGQSDFIRGARYSEGGVAIIALKSTTSDGISKIVERSPAGITTTAVTADQVVLVTEHGALDPRGSSMGERAIGIAHLAPPHERDRLLKIIHDDPAFHKPDLVLRKGVPGFTPYAQAIERL